MKQVQLAKESKLMALAENLVVADDLYTHTIATIDALKTQLGKVRLDDKRTIRELKNAIYSAYLNYNQSLKDLYMNTATIPNP